MEKTVVERVELDEHDAIVVSVRPVLESAGSLSALPPALPGG